MNSSDMLRSWNRLRDDDVNLKGDVDSMIAILRRFAMESKTPTNRDIQNLSNLLGQIQALHINNSQAMEGLINVFERKIAYHSCFVE